jgi:hypothetical protein
MRRPRAKAKGRPRRPTAVASLVLGPAADPVLPVLEKACTLLVQHPVAAQAMFAAFVAEGRRFAKTDEGRAWAQVLSQAEVVQRGRVLWEDSFLNVLEDSPDTVIPSAILDAVVQAARRADVHALLENLFVTGKDGDGASPA